MVQSWDESDSVGGELDIADWRYEADVFGKPAKSPTDGGS